MRKILDCFFFFVILSTLTAGGQSLVKNSAVSGVCYAGNKIKRIYVPPPDSFLKKGSKGGGTIIVNYSGFTNQATLAMEYAVSIIEAMLPPDARIIVNATFKKITTTGVLGASSITGYAAGWGIDAPNPLTYYPVTLAEKISGSKLNSDTDGDIILDINSSVNWYYGTDGKTPSNMYDLVTVVLHELCHGLGMYDSMDTDATTGFYGLGGIPMIYDSFVENQSGYRLTDTLKFRNNSNGLKSQLISNQIFFNGPVFRNFTVGSRARLYAPSKWDSGSSIAHLDEDSTPDPEALMTPFIDLGEAIHNPGRYAKWILADLGWVNTRIIHTAQKDTEQHLTEIQINAEIKSDTVYNHGKVGVIFSYDNFHSRDTVFLVSPNSDNNYKTTLAIPSYNSDLQYYLFTEDCFHRIFNSPSLVSYYKYETYVGTDTVKPVLTHTPQEYFLQTIDTLKISTIALDNMGIDTVYMEYRLNDGEIVRKGLLGDKDVYSTYLNAKQLHLQGGDKISYRIFAVDSAHIANTSVIPSNGSYIIPVEGISSVVDSYSTDFSSGSADFFNRGFEIMRPLGFSKFGLHSKHPYESPEDNDKKIQYTSLLRHPLKFDDSGLLINFSEIVLVEPGETGSVYGSDDFYDYVVLEGSTDFGKTWFSLADGYDSRIFKDWADDYNNSVIGYNSNFDGTESMFRKHTIYYRASDKIATGDTIIVRFRMFSDPFSNGWGWAIQDLSLNPLIDAIEENINGPLRFYPNPGNGIIKFDIPGAEYQKPFRYSVYNYAGFCMAEGLKSDFSGGVIDISAYPSGIYIIVLYLDDGVRRFKYTLIR